MEIASVGSRALAAPQAAQVQENEAAERVPDNEAAEVPKANTVAQLSPDKAPLPAHAGTFIDTQA